MASSSRVTNTDIYDRLERLRLEIATKIDDMSRDHKVEIADLRKQYVGLENRVIEMEISQLKKDALFSKNQAVLSTKVLVIFAIVNIILIGLSEAVFRSFIK